jgi:hypothetical protein
MVEVTAPPAPLEQLSPASTTSERVKALTLLLDVTLVARAASVTPAAVRKWISGTEPRPETTMVIDDLRSVVLVLSKAGFEPARVRSWLLSADPDWLAGRRPLECLSDDPGMVRSAANDAAVSYRFGSSAREIDAGSFEAGQDRGATRPEAPAAPPPALSRRRAT